MHLHLSRLPRLILQRQSTAIFGVIIIAMVWIGVAAKYWEGSSNDRQESERIISNFGMLFEENVLRSIGEIDKALLYLRRTVESKQWDNYQLAVLSNDVLSEIIVQVAIIDAKGIMRASNAIKSTTVRPIDLSDRAHFKAHVNSRSDLLYISAPVLGRASKKWSVQFTRRFLNPDGTFGGVVVASLNPAHFTEFYERVKIGSSASISMIGNDGIVRSSGGDASGRFDLGLDLTATTMGGRLAANEPGIFEDSETFKDNTRLVALRKVKGYPLWVSVTVRTSEIFARSRSNFQVFAIAGLILSILILATMERMLRSESSAKLKSEQLRLTLEHMSQGIMLVTKDLDVPVINSRCSELLGLPPQYISDPPRFDKIVEYQTKAAHAPDQSRQGKPAFLEPPRDTNASAGGITSSNISVSEQALANGRIVEVRSTHLPDGSFVQTFADVTKRREAEEHVARLASEDPLTGLPNRRIFRAMLEQLCGRFAPWGQGVTASDAFSVLFLDLDRFKIVNDTLGHRIGDMLLREVARRLRSRLGSDQHLARLGGDEFAVIAPKMSSRTSLVALASDLAETVCAPYEIDGHHIRTSVSIGIAIAPQDGASAEDLLIASDLALYSVKANGRGTHQFYDRDMNAEAEVRRQIEIDLREAVERESFELHFQPIIDLGRGTITEFEALIRWRHPVQGLVPPSLFIPVAEDTGLVLKLGEWVIRQACRTAAAWPKHISVAVNLSPVQFAAADLADTIERVLRETGLHPSRLEIEITESVFLDKTNTTLATLHRLKKLGIRVALDDFGTGYSSLSYLQSFPFDKIKVDRSFIADLGAKNEHGVIVQAIVSIARALGMRTTAEGVETIEQLKLVEALGCNECQGYLFSAPVSGDRLDEFINKPDGKVLRAA